MPLPRNCTFSAGDWTVLARCWHPVALSADVTTGAPFAARLLDQDLVLYRTATGLTAAADLCVHRGAPLSLGCMKDGAIACAYHGYRYDGTGRCTLIPAHPGAPVPAKLNLRTFGVLERYGLVWVKLDEGNEHATPPAFAEHDDAAYQVIHVPPSDWAASAGRQLESFCDVAHFTFVHTQTFAASDPVVPRYEVEATPEGVRAEFISGVGNVSDPTAAGRNWRRLYHIHLPFTAHLAIDFPTGGRLALLNASCPVSARRTRVFAVAARNFDHDQPVADLIAFQQRVYAEDQHIVERQNPEDLPIDLGEEVHVKADRTSIEYRRQLGRMGLGHGFTA